MQNLFIVSNRLPVSITKRKGILNFHSSPGGLSTGLGSLYKSYNSVWVGWPGISSVDKVEEKKIQDKLSKDNMHPVYLTKDDIEKYYEGFSNKTIWPLFHYFTQYTVYNKNYWATYKKVNKHFCDEIIKIAGPDDIIWVHDYHLMLLPGMIREKLPSISIGFFLHIPFPSFEIFRMLPWRRELMLGLLGSDVVGFHTYDYARHFLSAATRLIGVEHQFANITYEDRIIRVDSFPMGINYKKYADAFNEKDVKKEIIKFKQKTNNCRVILSIDRLDYSKGLLQRLEGFHLFLEQNPELSEKITLILLVVPSRSRVETYKRLKHQVDEMVGRINGEHGTIGWTPIWYFYRSLPFPAISALYNIADVALVTPFRDGMNLVAKEYIASKADGKGVLILSEMAGSADELGEAILINPNNIEEIASAIKQALTMPEEDQIKHNREMQEKLSRYNVHRWSEDFMDRLKQTKEQQHRMMTTRLDTSTRQQLIKHYRHSQRRLIFLDYDGTLVPFTKTPERAKPDNDLLTLIKKLLDSPGNEIILVSGRGKNSLEEWFGHLKMTLIAEHGAWIREKGIEWDTIEPLSQSWRDEIRSIFELYVDRTPGSFIETKEFSLVWHYRKADVGLGEIRARELANTLGYLTSNLDLQVLEGSKVVEVKNAGINKGRAALRYFVEENWDFILAVGDDWTDEDIFKVLPDTAYSIKVGFAQSAAKHKLKSYKEVRALLNEFTERIINETIT